MESIPDFVRMAEAYSHRAMRVKCSRDLQQMLADAVLDSVNQVFVDVLIDRTENVFPTLASDKPPTAIMLRPQVASEDL